MTGHFVQFGPRHAWINSRGICADDKNVYIEQHGYILTVNLTHGNSWTRFCRVGDGLQAMAAKGGIVYAVVNDSFCEVKNNAIRVLNPGTRWDHMNGMCFMNEQLWIIQRSRLHYMNTTTGGYQYYTKIKPLVNFTGVTLFLGGSDKKTLYVELQSGAFYRIYPDAPSTSKKGGKVEVLLESDQVDNPPAWASSIRAAAKIK
jgi:hypothetical protein